MAPNRSIPVVPKRCGTRLSSQGRNTRTDSKNTREMHSSEQEPNILLCTIVKTSEPPWQLAPPFASSQPHSLWCGGGGGVGKAREEIFLFWCKGKVTYREKNMKYWYYINTISYFLRHRCKKKKPKLTAPHCICRSPLLHPFVAFTSIFKHTTCQKCFMRFYLSGNLFFFKPLPHSLLKNIFYHLVAKTKLVKTFYVYIAGG